MSKRAQRRARAVRNARVREPVGVMEPRTGVRTEVRAPGRPAPPTSVVTVASPQAATELAERLQHGPLHSPVVVVTIPTHQDAPYVPVAELIDQVRGIAEVVLLHTGDTSWAFSRAMPALTQVFGGASRVYAPDRRWLADPYSAPLRFAYSAPDGRRNVDLLAGDAFAVAPRNEDVRPSERWAAATVLGTVAARAVVTLDDGAPAAVWAELTVAGVPIDRLLCKGQRVEGNYDPTSGRLDIRGMLAPGRVPPPPPADLSHVLVRVERVEDDGVTVAPVPGQVVEVPWERIGDASIRDLYQPGDVVVATWWSEDREPELRLDVWSEPEPVSAAPAILPGGPPWLEPADLTTSEPATEEPTPAEHPDEPDAARPRAEVELERALAEQRREIERLRREVQEMRRRARAGARQSLDGAERFELEVYREWRQRFTDVGQPPAMTALVLGPEFLPSLAKVEGVSRHKVVAVVVEVLTGLAAELAGRELHQLRTGSGGGDPYHVRHDGAKAWRVALQRETAAARRLHYWELADGGVELSRVVTHDDTAP